MKTNAVHLIVQNALMCAIKHYQRDDIMEEKVLNIITDLLKNEYDYKRYNDYQKFSLNIIEQNLNDLSWANKNSLINDIKFRLNDAFNITEYEINKLKDALTELPKRYHEEFINDVLVDSESIRGIRKVYSYYIDEIFPELSEKEKEPYYEKYLFISLR